MKTSRKRSHSTIRRIRNFRRWLRLPDQDLLRHEVRSAKTWLFGWGGLAWLLMPLLIKLLVVGLSSSESPAYNQQPGQSAALFAATITVRNFILLFTIAMLWLGLMRQRTFLTSSRQKMHDLALSAYTGRQFWPALIVAPVLIPAALMFVDALLDLPRLVTGTFVIRELVVFEIFLFVFKLIVLVLFTSQIAARCFANPSSPRIFFSIAGYSFQLTLVFASMFFLTCCITVPAFALIDALDSDEVVLHLIVFLIGALIFLYFALSFYVAIAKYNLEQLRKVDFLTVYRERFETPGRNRF